VLIIVLATCWPLFVDYAWVANAEIIPSKVSVHFDDVKDRWKTLSLANESSLHHFDEYTAVNIKDINRGFNENRMKFMHLHYKYRPALLNATDLCTANLSKALIVHDFTPDRSFCPQQVCPPDD
jgi:hypothetical protein